ncbi:tryptophan 7-halogenase [Cellvibrio sp.]|uniref:tryptophan 7-halogenase n=1 Tax=Cellvibrio sp. TaxID=1965322 RepID=UPI0039647626
MNSPLNKVVIVGGGLIAWWASIFIKKTNPQIEIILVNTGKELDCVTTVEEDFPYLLKLIGVSVKDLFRYADGNYAIAQAYFNWSPQVEHYFHSSFVAEMDYELAPYNQWLLKLKQAGNSIQLDDYLPASAAAKQGKVALTSNQDIVNGNLSFDSEKFLGFLKSYAQQLLISKIDGCLSRVCLTEDGFIESLELKDGSCIHGDFFIDATGGDSLLLGSALNIAYESWSEYLPFDCKKTLTTAPRSQRRIPFVAIQPEEYGWIKNIPLGSQLVAEFRFSSAVEKMGERDALERMFSSSESHPYSPGMRKKSWTKNCLALGEAAVTFDGFSHSSLYMAAVSLKRFTEFWPSTSKAALVADEYNRLMKIEYEVIRDFHCLHYFLAKKTDSPVGRLLGDLKISSSLQYRVDLFCDTGHLCTDESTLVTPSQWTNLFLGLGCWPKKYDYLLSHVPLQSLESWRSKVKEKLNQELNKAPEYTPYITRVILGS